MLGHGHKKTGDENHQILISCPAIINHKLFKSSPPPLPNGGEGWGEGMVSGIRTPGIRRADGAGIAADFASAKIHLEG